MPLFKGKEQIMASYKKYMDNYKIEKVTDSSKRGYRIKYTYVGDYYRLAISDSSKKKAKLAFLLGEVITIALFLIASLISSQINRNALIILPSGFSICAWFFEIIAIIHFLVIKDPYKEDDYKSINKTLPITFAFRFICLIFISVSCLILLLLSTSISDFIITISYIGCAITSISMYSHYQKISKSIYRIENK